MIAVIPLPLGAIPLSVYCTVDDDDPGDPCHYSLEILKNDGGLENGVNATCGGDRHDGDHTLMVDSTHPAWAVNSCSDPTSVSALAASETEYYVSLGTTDDAVIPYVTGAGTTCEHDSTADIVQWCYATYRMLTQ